MWYSILPPMTPSDESIITPKGFSTYFLQKWIYKLKRNTAFIWTFCMLICLWNLLRINCSLRDTFKLIFLFVKLNLFLELILFTELVLCWIFVLETWCMLIFLFVKIVKIFLILKIFSSRNLFYSWKWLRADFCSWELLQADFFHSWNFLHIDFSFCGTCTLIFLHVKLILFLELYA